MESLDPLGSSEARINELVWTGLAPDAPTVGSFPPDWVCLEARLVDSISSSICARN